MKTFGTLNLLGVTRESREEARRIVRERYKLKEVGMFKLSDPDKPNWDDGWSDYE